MLRWPLAPDSFGFILLLGMVASFQAVCILLMLPALPMLAQDFGTTPDIAQLTISGFFLGIASGQLICGALSDRFGRRPVLLGGVALCVVAGAGCTLAPNIGTLIAFRVLHGMGAAATGIVGRAIFRDLFERERAIKAMSAMVSINSLVPMAGPPLAGLLLLWTSWRGIYLGITLLTLVLALLCWLRIAESLARPDPRATEVRSLLRNCFEMLRRPECMSFVLIGATMFGGLMTIQTITPFVVHDSFALNAVVAGALIGATAGAYIVGAVANNRLTGRWPVHRVLRVSTSLALGSSLAALAAGLAIAAGSLSVTAGLVALAVPMLLFSVAFGAANPTSIVMSLQPLPNMAGTAAALGATVQTLAGALFAWLVAYLYDGTPVALGYGLVLACAAAFLVFTFGAARYSPATVARRR